MSLNKVNNTTSPSRQLVNGRGVLFGTIVKMKEFELGWELIAHLFSGVGTIFGELWGSSARDFNIVKANRDKGALNNFRLGLTACRDNRLPAAITRLLIATKLAPSYGLTHFHLVVCYLRLEKMHKVRKHYAIALQLRPSLKVRLHKEMMNFRRLAPDLFAKPFFDKPKINVNTKIARLFGKTDHYRKSVVVRFFEIVADWIVSSVDGLTDLYRRIVFRKHTLGDSKNITSNKIAGGSLPLSKTTSGGLSLNTLNPRAVRTYSTMYAAPNNERKARLWRSLLGWLPFRKKSRGQGARQVWPIGTIGTRDFLPIGQPKTTTKVGPSAVGLDELEL